MADSSPTYLAVITPAGRGAVATIGVRGPRAIEFVGRRFAPATGKPLAAFEIGRVVFGRFQVAAASAEEAVVGIVGPGEVEFHCHGGLAAVEAVAAALVTEGAERIDWRQWAGDRESDAIAAEALVALAAARTERTAAILLDQYRGALSSAAAQVGQLVRSDFTSAARELAVLVDRASLGRHLTAPWRVVLAGRPNVGKSSLINALVGYQRSIVWNEPGTTRDVLTATTALDGWPVELADTAGLRAGGDPIEAAGVERAQAQIAAADVVLLVCDWAQPWTAADDSLVGEIRILVGSSRPMLIVHNKCDLPPAGDRARPAGLAVSALTGEGLRELERQIANVLVPEPPLPRAPVPFTDRQVRLLSEALAATKRNDAVAAQQALERLVQ
jgi:tRNA modification GTPase